MSVFIIRVSLFIVKFALFSACRKLLDVYNAEIRGRKRKQNFELRFFVGVFLEIRDHGHDFLLAQVKTEKKG